LFLSVLLLPLDAYLLKKNTLFLVFLFEFFLLLFIDLVQVLSRVRHQAGQFLVVQRATLGRLVEVKDVPRTHVPGERIQDVGRGRVGRGATQEKVLKV